MGGLEETETLQLVTRLGSWDKPRKPLLFFEVLDVVVEAIRSEHEVNQLIQGEAVEPTSFHGAVLVAQLQGVNELAAVHHERLGSFLDTLHTLSATENILLTLSSEELVAVSGYDGDAGELQLTCFAMALQDS
ncbi:unnamed protein product [Durusdinium trenchii]|uniref:Uncharacterized protein n=2 Tax=Durusdinium trenchii TaxID=1381693 RepID=A0ABP0T2R3_9DINO